MKYCALFSNKINLNAFDEIAILYDRQDKELVPFMQKYSNKKIILRITNLQDFYEAKEWKKLNAIHQKYPELGFTVCFKEVGYFTVMSEMMVECIQSLEIPYFTGDTVVNFDQLHYLVEQGVSEVYLAEDICFDLKRAKKVCDNYGVQIRAFPNVAQGSIQSGPALKKFFIRPEDVVEYEDCISTLEFWGPTNRQEILYRIYKKGVWLGDLNQIILDFDLSFDSSRIVPGFAQLRKSCGRKCMKGEHCSICDRVLNISEKLKQKNLVIKKKKNN